MAAAGSLLFALAPAWEVAAVGRTLVGIGVSVAFISVLKLSAVWFAPQRFATLAGVTMFAGNLGRRDRRRAARVDRHADILALGLRRPRSVLGDTRARHMVVRTRSARGLRLHRSQPAGAHQRACTVAYRPRPRADKPGDLAAIYRQCRRRRQLSCLRRTLGGALPAGRTRHVASRGREHSSLLLLGVAFGSMGIGMISDRLGSRRGVMRAAVLLYTLSWLPWLLHAHWPVWATLVWFLLMGLVTPRLYAVVDDRQGSEPGAVFRHRDFGRQHRDIPRRRHPAAARRLGARPRQSQRGSGVCLGSRADGAGRRRSHGPRRRRAASAHRSVNRLDEISAIARARRFLHTRLLRSPFHHGHRRHAALGLQSA